MNTEELVKKIFTDRGFEARDYQIRNIIGKYITPIKPHVTAIGTSGGKSWTNAARFEFLYKYDYLKPNEKVLILAADKSILRGNLGDSYAAFFKNIPASFTWRTVANKKELEKAIEDDIQVIITLPQSINTPSKLKLLSKFNFKWFVQDEAHKWYFQKTVQRIIKIIKPDYQSLLTGTPFKFNMKAKDFLIDYTSVREMYERGFLSNFTAQVLHSDVTLTKLDYVGLLGNLKSGKQLSSGELTKSFGEVITQIIKKLKLPFKGLSTTHNITNNIASVFGTLQKTIIFTHGIPEADCWGEYLNHNNVNFVITHSKTGLDSTKVFDDFKHDDEIKVLVAVNQGKEGFDFPELYNVIDMTYSQNFEVGMQIIGRVLRKSENITNKYFFKVAPKNTSGYFVDWMNALFMLFDEEWYSQFNGKNGFDIQIPNALLGKNKSSKSLTKGSGGKSNKGNFKSKNLDFFNSLQFMEDNKWFKMNDKLSTVATTTLRKICIEHFKNGDWNGYKKDFLTSAEAIKFVNTLKLKSLEEWNEFTKSDKMPNNIPVGFKGYYKKSEGIVIGTAEWIGYTNPMSSNKSFVSYLECKAWFDTNNIKTQSQFRNWCNENIKPEYIPSSPDNYYEEWNGWGEFTGSGNNNGGLSIYKPFTEVRKFIRSLKFKNITEYDNWYKLNKSNDIPNYPDKCKQYKIEWTDWEDYLGCKIANTIDMKLSDKEKIKICNLYKKLLKQNDGNPYGICVNILNEFYTETNVSINQIRKCVRHLQIKRRSAPYTKADIPTLEQKLKNVKGMKEARIVIGQSAYNFLKEVGIIKKLFPYRIVGNQFGLKEVKK